MAEEQMGIRAKIVVCVLAVLLCGGLVTAVWRLANISPDAAAAGTLPPVAASSQTASSQTTSSGPAPSAPAASSPAADGAESGGAESDGAESGGADPDDAPKGEAAASPDAGPDPHTKRALEVINEWDRLRAEAWGSGDVAKLQDLYLPESSAGVKDAAALGKYTRRGLVVADMRRQIFEVAVLAASDNHLRVRLTDRLAAAVAIDEEGNREDLPGSVAQERILNFVLSDGMWRVASVRVA